LCRRGSGAAGGKAENQRVENRRQMKSVQSHENPE
jgi:hypothetical protein